MNTKVIAHGVDVDGLASHAIIGKNVFCEHVFTDYPTFVEDLDMISRGVASDIIIADISPSGDKRVLEDVFVKNGHHNFKLWLDHHDWEGYRFLLNVFGDYVINANKSTGQIAADYFGMKDESSARLAMLGRIHDMNNSAHPDYGLALDIQKAINFSNISGNKQRNLERVVDSLKAGNFGSDEISLMVRGYDKISDEAKKDLSESYFVKETDNGSFCFGFPGQVLYMKEGLAVLRGEVKGKADYLITAYPSGSVIMSTEIENPKVDIVEVCKSYNGGGRNGGGGFILKDFDKESFVGDFLDRVENYKIGK